MSADMILAAWVQCLLEGPADRLLAFAQKRLSCFPETWYALSIPLLGVHDLHTQNNGFIPAGFRQWAVFRLPLLFQLSNGLQVSFVCCVSCFAITLPTSCFVELSSFGRGVVLVYAGARSHHLLYSLLDLVFLHQ